MNLQELATRVATMLDDKRLQILTHQ